MKPRPKSVVLDLLSTLRGHSAPVRFLVAAAGIFDIEPNATRVAITRLLSCGLIERDERGAYRTGPSASPIVQRLNSWRKIETRTRQWDGSWIGAAPGACGSAKDVRGLGAKALEFTGMREFSPGLWIRPNNLEGGLAAIRQTLLALPLTRDCPVFTLGGFDAVAEARARALWDAAAIRDVYRSLSIDLERSSANLLRMDERRAMAESFLLGGEAIRRIVLDPLLPDTIVPTAERKNFVRAMLAYDELGRRCWAAFLGRYGILASESPMDRQVWRGVADIAATPA